MLSEILWNSISYFDYGEEYYHGMLNGIFTSRGYVPDSNDEAGLGWLDLRVKDRGKRAILLLEFKRSEKKRSMSRKKQRAMAEKLLVQKVPNVNRGAKDSVFCDLFEKPEYLIQLYRVLHPEDKVTQEDDLTIVTLTSVFLKGIYNDLGFMLGNRLIVLVEAQSTFAYNIVVRLLMYLAETYRRYIDQNDLDEYSTTPMELPRPEFYMVFTGEGENKPKSNRVRIILRVITNPLVMVLIHCFAPRKNYQKVLEVL